MNDSCQPGSHEPAAIASESARMSGGTARKMMPLGATWWRKSCIISSTRPMR